MREYLEYRGIKIQLPFYIRLKICRLQTIWDRYWWNKCEPYRRQEALERAKTNKKVVVQ